MTPNFSKLVLKFWKLVSKRKYASTPRIDALTPRKYALKNIVTTFWETDFYTPQVLGGGALSNSSAPAVYKIQGP